MVYCNTFFFVQPLLRQGFSKPLGPDDALKVPSWLAPALLHERFRKAWTSERGAAEAKAVKSGATPTPSVFKCLVQLFGARYSRAIATQLLSVCCRFGNTVLLRRLTALLLEADQSYEGYILAAGISILSVFDSLFTSSASCECQRIALGAYNVFGTSVLNKAIVLHPSAQEKHSRGVLVSLGLSDLNRVVEQSRQVSQGSVVPFMILGAQVVGCIYVGPIFLVSLPSTVVTMMLMINIGKRQGAQFRKKASQQGRRLGVLNEMLQNMRLTKYYQLEVHFKAQMLAYRKLEENALLWMKRLLGINWAVSILMPVATFLLLLVGHHIIYGELPSTPDMFASLAVIRLLSFPLAFFGNFLTAVNMLLVSCRRLRDVLMQPEVSRRVLSDSEEGMVSEKPLAVDINKASFSWQGTENIVLHDLNLQVPQGHLVVLVGELGSGKSSVLGAILGEMEEVSTACRTRVFAKQVAFCAQEPSILNATVRENVLFGAAMQKGRYEEALEVAALGLDLGILPSGDETEIGERGLTLSGGQKARVALARAVYAALGMNELSDTLLLLDDPLSAVDAHVGSHIWDECICGALKGTTRILVTNQVQYLSHSEVSKILVLENGVIIEQGTHNELCERPDGRFRQMLDVLDTKSRLQEKQASANVRQTVSLAKNVGSGVSRVTKDEGKNVGAVAFSVFLYYFRRLGTVGWIPLLLFLAWLYYTGQILPDLYFAAFWMEGRSLVGEESFAARICVWLIVGLFGAGLCLNYRMLWAVAAVRASGNVHMAVLSKVLSGPMSFFDSTPSGQIMNRLGEDQMVVDWALSLQMEVAFLVWMAAVNIFTITFCVCPWYLPVLILLLPTLYCLREIHRRSSRECARFWMLTKSPMFHTMEETLMGVPTVAAYGRLEHFIGRFEDALAANNAWSFSRDSVNEWAEQRLHWVGSLTAGGTAASLIAFAEMLPASMGSVALMSMLELGMFLRWSIFFAVMIEGSLAAMERCKEYIESTPQEASLVSPDDKLLLEDGWPGDGAEIIFEDLVVRYQPHLPPALRNLSAKIKVQEKVGAVGRTGSGKSTLLSSLFRLVEADGGRLLVGGRDIATIGLGLLRSRITIVPQDPLLFSGDLRRNLDPTASLPESKIAESLQRCGLAELARLGAGLEAQVEAQGKNFSVGERQVLCLARALLRGTGVLCLDEATANVDPENDVRMQRTLRFEFKNCTVLTVAHRLHTVMDSDRIMVLEEGQLVQFGAPKELLAATGPFLAMAREAGISAEPNNDSRILCSL